MTSFNTPAILMPLDEYYVQCVEPKPKIPKRYGFHADKRQRQAARLQSYKDNSADEEDEFEDEGEEPKQVDEHYSCKQDSNMDEISFDSKDFNHLCEPTDEPMDTSKGAEVLKTEIPVTSVQWRIKPNNVNRPQGAAPLVPKDAPRNQPKSQSARRYQNKPQNRRPFNLKNNNNNKHNNTHYTKNKNTSNRNNALNNRLGNNPVRNQQRGQMPTEQRLRNAYNRFNNTPTNNHSSNNNNYTNNNNYKIRTISNELARSKNTYNGALGQPMNQLNIVPNKANGDIVASDSLRLADLMNMDKESCVNLNVAEVAKNAMLLLSTVFHKPILDEDVQQQLSQMQKKNGHSGEPHGLDMTIKPETTEMRMYHRFK
ncbi:myb-like protein D [Drosophila hydei]|uniref:Myb-like protein D n=1 Tax=Drosophila hydei TaxID=7224 RepID=A0A6J1LEH8_DROHY|nr:myb-like protein D [Drosophila hydei]